MIADRLFYSQKMLIFVAWWVNPKPELENSILLFQQ